MPAHIKSVFLCPRCEEGITSIEITASCPNCGLPLGKQALDPYTPPYTFSEQNEKYLHREQLLNVLENLPIEKANSIVNDALLIIENIAGKKTRVEGIRTLMGMAIRIGEVATAYENFLKAGGRHYPSFFIQQQQQNQENQSESTRERMVELAPPIPSANDSGNPEVR